MPAHHARVARSDAGLAHGRPPAVLRGRARGRRRRAPRLRRRRPGLAPARRAGAAAAARRPARSSGSACRRRSATRTRCWTGCRARTRRAGAAIAPVAARSASGRAAAEVELDYVGSLDQRRQGHRAAAPGREAAGLLRQSRPRRATGAALRRATASTTFVSHCSLSVGRAPPRRAGVRRGARLRHRRDPTLELGIDVGDLDRVIQIDAPRTVASFLQRIGRTGGAPAHTERLFLATTDDAPARRRAAAALGDGLRRAGRAPPRPAPHRRPADPRARAAGGVVSLRAAGASGGRCDVMADGDVVLDYLRADTSSSSSRRRAALIGPRAEQEFGGGTSWISSPPSSPTSRFRCLTGRREIGSVAPLSIDWAGRRWPKAPIPGWSRMEGEAVDWEKHEVAVEEDPEKGSVRWAYGARCRSRSR